MTSSYSRPRVGKLLGGQDLEVAVDRAAGQVGGGLAAPVQDEDARAGVGGGQVGRGGVGDVVGDVAHTRRVEAGQGAAQEQRSPLGVQGPQPLPGIGGHVRPGRRGQGRVVGVGDRVQFLGGEAGLGQAPGRRPLGQLPGGERHRQLAVLAAGEPLLLGRGHDLAVDHQRGRRVVEHRVHTEHTHLVILCTIGFNVAPRLLALPLLYGEGWNNTGTENQTTFVEFASPTSARPAAADAG